MSGIRLPRKLQRRIEGGYDPLAIFQEIVEIPAVTFNEYLLYDYVLEEAEYLRDRLAAGQQDKLSIRFTEASQLLASWCGRPDDPSKTILVAHVDREGFLVREYDHAAGTAICWHTSGEAPPTESVGSRVRLFTANQAMKGVIERVTALSSATPVNPFDHEVVVRIDQKSRERNRNTGFRKNNFFEGLGVYDIPSFSLADGIISAVHVDNPAGVSVLISLLTAVARNSWRANIDFLFTTCEEAGFCGIVAEILNGQLLTAKKGGKIMCLVVDSSSHAAFVGHKQLWDVESLSTDDGRREEVGLRNPVVRTGDKISLFDPEVSRLLSVAADNLQTSPSRQERIPWAGRHRPTISDKLRETLKGAEPSAGAGSGSGFLTGRMRGGWCEATPLMLSGAMRERRGGLLDLNLRVGSVAIPIAHYRNYYKEALNPEKCHVASLRATCRLLGEAVRLFHRWPFDLSRPSVLPPIPDRDERAKMLLDWQDTYCGLSSVTNEWIASLGARRGAGHPRRLSV